MNFLISFSQNTLPSGTTKISFENGIVTDSASTTYNMTGSNPSVESLVISTSIATTLYLFGDTDNIVYLPAGRYIRLKTNVESLKIISGASFNLWFTASTEMHSPEVT